MNDKLARGVWLSEAEGYSDSSDDTSEEDDASYVPPTAPCPCARHRSRVRGARGGDV